MQLITQWDGKPYMYPASSLVRDFFFEFIPGFVAVVIGLILAIVAAFSVLYVVFDPPTCSAKGSKMGLQTNWSFWTGCMVNLQGQWLGASDVIPLERDGKIVFAPKPVFRIQDAGK